MQKLHKGLYLDEIYFSNGVFRGESPIQYYCRNITTPPSNLGAVAGYSNDDEKVKIHSRRNIKLTAPYARRQICYPKGVVEHYNSDMQAQP